MAAVGRWAKRVTWPQAVVLYLGTIVVVAAGLWAIVPGVVRVSLPTYIEDPRDHPAGDAATRLEDTQITCPAGLGLFESSRDRVLRQAGEAGAPGSYAREYYERRQAACDAQQREHLLVGAVGILGGIVATAALTRALRDRGGQVVAARPPPIELPALASDDPPPVRCRRCQKVIPSLNTSPTTVLEGAVGLCHRCRVQRQAPFGTVLLATSVALVAWGLVLAWTGAAGDLTAWLLIGGSFTPLLYAQVAPHEAGHAIAATFVRIRVPEVVIGVGPTLGTLSVAGTTVTIRAVPTSGSTMVPCTSTAWFRLRTWLAVAGGPAVSVLTIVLAIVWNPHQSGPAATLRTMVIVTAGWILLVSLLPRKVADIKGVAHTDGWHLVKIPALSTADVRSRVSTNRAMVAIVDALRHRSPPVLAADDRERLDVLADTDPSAGLLRFQLLLTDRSWGPAAAAARDLLTEDGHTALDRSQLLNAVAWCRLVDVGVHPGDEADTCSAEALWLDPGDAGVLGTRGSILVETGAPEQGLELLRRSLDLQARTSDQALTTCYLAIAEAAAGRQDEAEQALATAELLDPECYLLDRARARVHGPEPGDGPGIDV